MLGSWLSSSIKTTITRDRAREGVKGVSAMSGNKVKLTYNCSCYSFTLQVKLGINQIKRWNTSMKFDYFFATQYRQSFVYFGSDIGTTAANKDGDICTMNGCIATVVEGVNKEDSYIWSPMPHHSLRLGITDNVVGNVKLCGGYTSDKDIKMFGEISKPEYSHQMFSSKGYYMSKVIPQCWTTSLTVPSQCNQWVEDTQCPPKLSLLSIQKSDQYVIHFYLYNNFTITDCKGVSCSFSTGSVHMNRHVKCALLNEDMFVISGNKMAKIEKFRKFLISTNSTCKEIDFTFDVPHINSTPFIVQGVLFVVGGCDQDHEPFSDIYQFDYISSTWSLCGLSTVSRYGVSVVVFTDKYHCEAVFIAGGFKGDSIPCSVIEKVPVVPDGPV